MSTLSLLARNVARQSFGKTVRVNPLRAGAIRFSSTYFTPGKYPTSLLRLWYHPIVILAATILILILLLILLTAHEYVKVEGNIGTCGITDFAQAALGDIVFVDLPEVGDTFDKGDSFGSVESVKAASDVYAPVAGTVVEVNDKLSDEPAMVNEHAESDAWFIKIEIKDEGELSDLLSADAYKEHCENEAH